MYTAIFGSPTVTRFERDAKGHLTPTGEVSFLPAGLTSLTETSRSFVFLAPDDALYVDRVTSIVVRWDPQEMTITSTFEIPGLLVDGEPLSLLPTLRGRQGDDLLLYGRYTSDGLFSRRSAFVRLDVTTETATVDVDERCGALTSDLRASDGATYFASAPVISSRSQTVIDGSLQPDRHPFGSNRPPATRST